MTRRDVHDFFGGKCVYCGVHVGLKRGTVDHYVPKVLGGTNERSNLRWCCAPCNQAKGSLPPQEWERIRPRQAAPVESTRVQYARIIAQRAKEYHDRQRF
jgi:5-methylcytosine-specific restriction endonuclease McrA